jgi:hypothetical protein
MIQKSDFAIAVEVEEQVGFCDGSVVLWMAK